MVPEDNHQPQQPPAAPAQPQEAPGTPGGAGSSARVLADLARERDRRQALETELQQLRDSADARQREQDSAETARVRARLEDRANSLQQQLSAALAGRTLDQARIAATAAGVDPAHVDTFLRLVDLSSIQVGADGALDTTAIGAAVTAGLDSAPMFKPALPGSMPGARRALPGSGAGATPAPVGDLNASVAAKVAAMQAHLGQSNVTAAAAAR